MSEQRRWNARSVGLADEIGLLTVGGATLGHTTAHRGERSTPASAVEWIVDRVAENLTDSADRRLVEIIQADAALSRSLVAPDRRFDGDQSNIVSCTATSLRSKPLLRSSVRAAITSFRMEDDRRPKQKSDATGTQAVTRALDILFAIADRPMLLPELAEQLGLSQPTCYRIATALAQRGLLSTSGRSGYTLGPMISELAVIRSAHAVKTRKS